MEGKCKKLRVDPFGDVASRVVSLMERLNNIIDTRGWKSQLKPPNVLKTFIKAVDSCITPFDVRDRVEEQMKTVQASTLVEFDRGRTVRANVSGGVDNEVTKWRSQARM
ncbi:hypothetical protein AaE_015833 [Aphanomyces astaci]|uniref:Uncharacterized protein n=1 Tax=Aphanomyces astaci TaxID=112090 RepID=A0A6A4YZZ7_APHAT|nr:hypothetical protein AaE_015833 [Aphanomyces astaci]